MLVLVGTFWHLEGESIRIHTSSCPWSWCPARWTGWGRARPAPATAASSWNKNNISALQHFSFTAFQLCRFAALQHFSFTAFQIYSISACTIHGCFKLQPKQLFSFTQSRWIRRQKPRPPGVKTRFTFLPKSSKLLKVSATIWINVPRLPGWKRWSTLFGNIINNIQVFYKT